MNNRLKNIIKLLLCTVVMFSIGPLSRFLLLKVNININNLGYKGSSIYQFVISLILFFLLIFVYFDKYKKDYKEFMKNKYKNFIYLIKMFLIFIIIKYLISVISVVILLLFGYDTSSMTSLNQELIEAYVKAAPILMFFTSGVLAPFYEEGLFRLGLRNIIKNKWLFIIISGTIFGLIHVFPLESGISLTLGLIQSIIYITIGMVLSYIYCNTDNIYMSTGIHLLNNVLSILAIINTI